MVSWVLCWGGGIWLQGEAIEEDVPSELLEDVAVTVAEDICSRTAHFADDQAGEAGSTAQL